MKLWEHPTRSLQSLQRFKTIISIMTSNKGAQLNHGLNLRYYRPHCTRDNNPKTRLQITQEGDEEQF